MNCIIYNSMYHFIGKNDSLRVLDDHETVINEHLVLAEVKVEQKATSFRKRMLQELELKIELIPIYNKTRDASFAFDQVKQWVKSVRISTCFRKKLSVLSCTYTMLTC